MSRTNVLERAIFERRPAARSAAISLALSGLAALWGCPGGDGDGEGSGCPNVAGEWTVGGDCNAGTCIITQDEDTCAITLECDNGTWMGSSTPGSLRFSGSANEDGGAQGSCSGTLSHLEDDDGDGLVQPQAEGTCSGAEGMCTFEAECFSGACREAPVEEGDGGADEGAQGGQGGTGVIIGGDGDGDGDLGGAGGIGGEGAAGASASGSGGIGGEGGSAGIGGDGGAGGSGDDPISPAECGGCLETNCGAQLSTCDTTGGGCIDIVMCAVNSCSADDNACVESSCAAYVDASTAEAADAAGAVQECALGVCVEECTGDAPTPFVPVEPSPGCSDTCIYAGDGECDDGDVGAVTAACEYSTDCTDCGPREPQEEPVGGCDNTCTFANDGECDDGGPNSTTGACALGTDCNDCGS